MQPTSLRKYVWEGIIESIRPESIRVRMVQIEPAAQARTTEWWPYGLPEEFTEFMRDMFSADDNVEMVEGAYFRWEVTQHLSLVRDAEYAMTRAIPEMGAAGG